MLSKAIILENLDILSVFILSYLKDMFINKLIKNMSGNIINIKFFISFVYTGSIRYVNK